MADTTKIYENIFIKKNAAGDREYIKVPYAILADPPTIPDVSGFALKSDIHGGTLTIQKNGTNVATFGANQSTNTTANITVPVKVSELTNDSGFTTNKGTITGINMNGASKGTSGVVDLGTVLTDESKFATSAQGTKADNAMPKSGGTFTGNISLPKELVFTDNTNPFIKMTTGGTDFYFQSTSGQFGLGPTWNKATHWDSNGNVTFPTVPKVGSSSLALKSEIPTNYVPNTRKVNNKALSSDITLGPSDVGALPTAGGTVTGNLTVGGNLTINGTTTTVDSTTLQVKDKLIEVAHGNTTKLTTPAGLVAPKYDGTNSGALVFDGDGTAYVGDVTLDSNGNISVADSNLQPLATRTGLVGGNLVQYDSTAQTLKDSGKKISDLATTSQVNAKYTKPSGGIPKTDLASSVQTSLGKADTALQSAPVTSVNGKTGAVTIDVPSAVTSINGLSGGTLTSPITLTGGDSTTASKMILDANGQITDTGTATLFGRSSGNLIVGSGSYPTTFRGKQTRPTYNGNDMALKSDIPDVSGKQDKLTAGANISISGNTISATVPTDVVKYTAQTLTTAQKSQARSNIGAGTSSFSGNYNDLLDKPSFDKLTRIQKQAYTGGNNTVQYFKLASFPVYNSGGNYASFIITGRMGGWQSDNMSFVNMILYNRNGEGGGYINVANSAFFNLCDIVMYREEDGTSTAYLKVKSYYTFDINVNTYQATNVYTGTDDTPTGTLKWTASEQADRLAVSGGVAYVNGFTLPKQVEINGTVVNPNSAGLVNLGTGFAKTADLPIKSATLSGTTLTITL